MLLNKNNILELKRKESTIKSDDYDLEIKIRALTLKEQLQVEADSKQDQNLFISNMIKYCCIDENGDNIFATDEEAEQLPADLSLMIFKECLKLNSLQEKDVEKLAKNS